MKDIFKEELGKERDFGNGHSGIHTVFLDLNNDQYDKLMKGLEQYPNITPALMTKTGITETKPEPGRVYYQFAPWDILQLRELDSLYRKTQGEQKAIILFGDADKDKERTARPRTYGGGQAQPIKDFGLDKPYEDQADRTFAFGITTTWKKPRLTDEEHERQRKLYAVTHPNQPFKNQYTAGEWETKSGMKYEDLMADQFKIVWDKYVSRGYDVVVPLSIKFKDGKPDMDEEYFQPELENDELVTSIGKGESRLPGTYHEVIMKHLLLLEKKTGKEPIYLPGARDSKPSSGCPWGTQYGLTAQQTARNQELLQPQKEEKEGRNDISKAEKAKRKALFAAARDH